MKFIDSKKRQDLSGNARIRLLKVVTNFSNGGTEGQVSSLAKALDSEQFDLRFVCLHKYGLFLDDLEKLNIPIHEFAIKKFTHPKTYWQMLKLAEFMRKEKIQVCHSYNFYSNLVAVPAAKLAGVPVVIASIRDRGVYLTPMQKRVQRMTCKLADRVLVNAESIREWLIKQNVDGNKISLIKNGIDLSRYENRASASGIRQESGFSEHSRLVIMLSRLNPQKGVEEFLRAAAKICSTHADVNFLIVGDKLDYRNGVITPDADYSLHLKAVVESLGISDRVSFTGHRTDVANILLQCNLSVLPSYSEGLSNSLIESMAAGLPIVATNVGGNPELIKQNINGLLVPVQDADALATAISVILDDPARMERFGIASRQLCAEQFSTLRMAESTQQLYVNELQKRSCTGVTERTS